jgi:hypothetical protein
MTIDQAAQMISALALALQQALIDGSDTIDLTTHLQAADDVARADLSSAIEQLQKELGYA